ncbi:DUF2891 family protein [Corynebacterium striatum]|uniref:DUF2891 family protein n=1 Tax=Corynebacterium striatum TaxID=43770 RepID=UPI003F7F7DEC
MAWDTVTRAAITRPWGELHPSFGNSFDWHSSVHMHWLLSILLSSDEEASGAWRTEALRILVDHLHADKIKVEADYLHANPTRGLTPRKPNRPFSMHENNTAKVKQKPFTPQQTHPRSCQPI